MSDRRKSTSPYHLELLLFLRMNKLLWNKETVQECYDEAKSSLQESEESGADAANESDDSSVEEY